MRNLQIGAGCTVLKVLQNTDQNNSLEDQAEQYLPQNPVLILDVSDVQFNSMNIGELINLYRAFDKIWEAHVHLIGMLHMDTASAKVFKAAKLDERFPLFDSMADAFKALDS